MEDSKLSQIKGDADYIIRKVVGNGSKVDFIEKWGIGALNSCFKVSIKNSDMKYFLKIENDNIIPSTRRGQVEREVKGIELMNRIGIPCPALIHYDFTKHNIGKKYILEEFIESDLLWEVKDTLTSEENEYIKVQITDILNKMKSIKSDYYGDIYAKGIIGQHSTWKETYSAMWKNLLNDTMEMNLFNAEELDIVSYSEKYALDKIVSPYYASFYHGDLGKHNVLVNNLEGFRSIGTVFDFGNSIFCPFYMNEDLTRKYGGWGLDMTDPCEKYSISKAEYFANNLVFDFEAAVFSAMLNLRRAKDPKSHVDKFVESCKQYMQIH
jgi:Phosphotransferase enzyme family.